MPDAPPSRYRIVERDRRLIVIDTWGESARHAAPGGPSASPIQLTTGAIRPRATDASPLAAPRRVGFDGRAELVTHPFYDARAPRTLLLDPGSAALIGRIRAVAMIAAVALVVLLVWQPWLLAGVFAIAFSADARRRLRAWSTAWIDRLQARLG